MAVRIESHAEPIPGYRLIERLGGGGFGEVWKAEAPGGLHKAIKFVFGDLGSADDDSQRAEQELKALSRVKTVRHPYILSLERFDIIDGQLIIVMELAERNLWDRFKECRTQGLPGIPRDELLVYLEETAEALDLMNNTYQLQHLDIKPQNLFLMFQHVKVADFGLVKDLEGMQASVTGGVTPVYAAPETFDGWVSRFCDQYSLAIVYQELLTGQRPFNGSNVRQLILQHLQAAPDLSSLPPADRPVIARALSKTPDQRFPTCREMARLLRSNSAGPPPETPAAPGASAHANGLGPPPPVQPGRPAPADPPSSLLTSPPTACIRNKGGTSGLALEVGTESVLLSGEAPTRQAPAETKGDGALFPALVVGLGQMGSTVLQRLHQQLHERFGSPERVPNLRTLLIDTDSEVVRTATRGHAGHALPVQSVLLAPLNRPSYYLKARDGRPKLDSWLNPRMLYRIPRSQVTAGVRALGRLAFCENYRAVVRRLQAELDACVDPKALADAGRQTGAGVRTNRPRVYVVAGLAGGTGGGMFLDVAYTVRALLRRAGYTTREVVGLLLLPPSDCGRSRVLALGNTYAALTELGFFATPGNAFTAQYHEREAPLHDADPPFTRTFLLPLPDEGDEAASREMIELAGQFLAHDLAAPLGRAADLARAGRPAAPCELLGPSFHTFGLYRVAWPRDDLLRLVARRLCQRLVERWMSKDGKPVSRAVQTWLQEKWTSRGLGADQFIEKLRAGAERAFGMAPEDALQEPVAPLLRRYAGLAKAAAERRGGVPVPPLTAEEVGKVLAQYDELLGKPQDDGAAEEAKGLARIVREVAQKLAEEWEQRLAEIPVQLIEQPEFRLAGAEESVRHAVATLEQILQHHEPLDKDLAKRAADAYGRLRALVVPARPGGKPATLPPEDVLELLRHYPKWRYQSLLMSQVPAAFVGLRGHLSDELREINFLRVRLTELLRLLETVPEGGDAAKRGPAGRRLFPAGCKDLNEACTQFLAAITPETLLELDVRVQEVLRRDFTALVHVCLTNKNVLTDVEAALVRTAAEFAGVLLADTNVAEILLEQYPDVNELGDELRTLYEQAAPELAGRGGDAEEVCVLATPAGRAGEQIRDLTRRLLPDVELHPAVSRDDIVVYRELPNRPLAALEHLGPAGLEAYRQMTGTENFTPHTRIDIAFEPAASGGR